jgi:hypothetical protein
MLLDAASSFMILINYDFALAKLNAFLCAAPLLATFVYYGPQHDRIYRDYRLEKIKALINYNWLRVFFWSTKLYVAYKMQGTL